MTSRFTLAAHILGMLAWSERARAKPLTSEEMARSINTNPVVVRRVLSDLRRAGLVDTKRGVGGGVTLARGAESITLRDAYEAVEEGEELFGRHPSGPNPCCHIGPLVAEFMEEVYGRAEHALKGALGAETIASMSHEIESRYLARLAPPDLSAVRPLATVPVAAPAKVTKLVTAKVTKLVPAKLAPSARPGGKLGSTSQPRKAPRAPVSRRSATG